MVDRIAAHTRMHASMWHGVACDQPAHHFNFFGNGPIAFLKTTDDNTTTAQHPIHSFILVGVLPQIVLQDK